MAQLNRVFLIGNVTRDPELRYTPKGNAVVDLGLATNRTWRTETGEEKEEVCFVTVVVWGKQAEVAGKYLKKGRPVFIEGRLQYETWEKNGEKRSMLKVHCERLQLLGGPAGAGRGGEGEPSAAEERATAPSAPPPTAAGAKQGSSEPDLENDDIPF